MNSVKPKILVASYAFWPSLGGLELIAEHLARGLSARGHALELITFTPPPEGGENRPWPFRMTRRPGLRQSLAAFRNADVVISKHLSLRTCWPVLLIRRPLIVWHATWYPKDERLITRTLRRWIMRRARNIANSHAMGAALERCDGVVHPGYDETSYRNEIPWGSRPRSFVYVGRLGLEKGVDLLIDALPALPAVDLTVVGSGPAETQLKAQAQQLGVTARVDFVGRKNSCEINEILNQHKVMVAPSRYAEPFGTVALEGQAAGCRVVVSSGGGFPEAAGPGGIVFANGDLAALSSAMQEALRPADPALAKAISDHLHSHRIESFVNAFEAMTVSLR